MEQFHVPNLFFEEIPPIYIKCLNPKALLQIRLNYLVGSPESTDVTNKINPALRINWHFIIILCVAKTTHNSEIGSRKLTTCTILHLAWSPTSSGRWAEQWGGTWGTWWEDSSNSRACDSSNSYIGRLLIWGRCQCEFDENNPKIEPLPRIGLSESHPALLSLNDASLFC